MKALFCMMMIAIPLFCPAADAVRIGIAADIQYSTGQPPDAPDAELARSSADTWEKIVDRFNAEKVDCVIQLGDYIDDREPDDPEREKGEDADFKRVDRASARLAMPLYDVAGNNCRAALLRNRKNARLYDTFTRAELPGWRFVVLDSNDGRKKYVGSAQLAWLAATMREAEQNGERTVILLHNPLAGEIRGHVKNNDEVFRILDRCPNLRAVFSGHRHEGGYQLRNGVHHVTMRAVENHPDSPTYAVLTFGANAIEERGFGVEPSRRLAFPAPAFAALPAQSRARQVAL